ncbi:OmpA family protein [Actinomycetospora sp. CA-101289]|uniref:OmpA family protein n=1 Tax=Actinomycetospora sp. CA-101289 TaxID=3239893 RepID=UPI003D96C22B
MTRAAGPSLEPVRCPLCAVPPGPDGVCPDCGEDLTPLSHLQARPVLLYNRALALAAAGDDDRAVRAVSAALAEDERFADAWVVLGKLEARRGHRDDARRAWRSALDVEPGHAGAQAALAALDEAAPDPEPAPRRRVLPLVLAALLVLALVAAALAFLLPRSPGAPVAGGSPLTVLTRDRTVTVLGGVPDALAREALVRAAGAGAPGAAVAADGLDVAPGVPPPAVAPEQLTGLVRLLAAAPGAHTLTVAGGRAVLGGDPGPGLADGLRTALPGVEVVDTAAVSAPAGGSDARLLGDAVAAVQGLAPITFPGAAGDPSPAGAATARTLAGLLAGQRTPAVVEGYAARTRGGSPEGARQLSEVRAASVRAILVAGGVDPATITVRGLGDADPQPTVAASRRAVVRLGAP